MTADFAPGTRPAGSGPVMGIWLVFALASSLSVPATAQSDQTCIAYMEADAAYAAYEPLVHGTTAQKRALGEALDRLVDAGERRRAAKAAFSALFADAQRRKRTRSMSAMRARRSAFDAVSDARDAFYSSIGISDSAARQAASEAALDKLEAAKVVQAAVEVAIEMGRAPIENARSAIDAAVREREAARIEYDNLRAAAIAEGKPARDAAYREAYKGPTSSIASVMEKLIAADRERCRDRIER